VPPDFYDAWAKFRWAKRNVHTVHAEVLDILDPNVDPFAVRADFEPKREAYIVKVDWVRTLPDHLGLFIGDALQCLRAALDRLAWALVIHGSDPNPEKPNLVQFPIYDCSTSFEANVSRRLPGVSSPKRAAIESRQPYHGGDDGRYLQTLAKLSNDDKHRHVPAYIVAPQNASIRPHPVRCRVKAIGGPVQQPLLRPDAELAAIQIWADAPDHQMGVECNFRVYIAFDLPGIWDNRPDVPLALAKIRDIVRATLEDPTLAG